MTIKRQKRPARHLYQNRTPSGGIVSDNYRLGAYLTQDQDAWLSRKSQETGLSRAHLVRSLIDVAMRAEADQ